MLTIHDASSLSTSSTPHIAYGLKNGCFGMIDMQRDTPLILWDVNDTHASDAPINIIYCGKFIDEAEDNDVVIARDDGSLEIYSFSDTEQPYLKYVLNFQESIVGVGIGNISRANYKEIVVSLFSGKIAGLVDSNAEDLQEDNTAKDRKQKIVELAKEKESLMKKKIKKQAQAPVTAATSGIIGYKTQYKFSLVPSEAAYTLTLESQVNMSVILLQSTIIIDLLDVDDIPA